MTRPRGWRRLTRKGDVLNLLRILLQFAWPRLFSALYVPWLRLIGVRIGRGCLIRGPIRVHGDPRRVTIGEGCSIHPGVVLWTHDYGEGHGKIVLGRRVVCMPGVVFNSHDAIEVGDDTAFGDGCYVQDNDHGTVPGQPIMRQPLHSRPISIGADVWFGARSIVLKGVAVGDGTVVGAGSVVVRSLAPGVVAVGVPCRAVKRRGEGARAAYDAEQSAA